MHQQFMTRKQLRGNMRERAKRHVDLIMRPLDSLLHKLAPVNDLSLEACHKAALERVCSITDGKAFRIPFLTSSFLFFQPYKFKQHENNFVSFHYESSEERLNNRILILYIQIRTNCCESFLFKKKSPPNYCKG